MKFYVGQRVRVVRPDLGSLARGLVVGDVGTIDSFCRFVDFRVEVDGKSNPRTFIPTFPMWADELEPILDDGRQAISWADMADLWTPERVEA